MKKYGIEERQAEREAKHDDEDVDHAFLRVEGADFDDLFAVGDGGRGLVEVEVFLDENDRAVGAGDDGLRARAGEPVNHRAAHEQAENDLRLHEAQVGDGVAEDVFEQHDDAENHRGGADDGGADQHGLGGGLEGVARAVAFFEFEFGVGEIGLEAEILFDFRADVGQRFDAAQFINGLRVVGDGAEAVHGNGHRRHREKTKRDQAEGENRRGENELRRE